jgi:hypothetical protein
VRKLGDRRENSSNNKKHSSCGRGVARTPRKAERILQDSSLDCSRKENLLVDEFFLDDTNEDGVITCDEAKAAIERKVPNFPIENFQCEMLFAELMGKPGDCFVMTNDGASLALTAGLPLSTGTTILD